MGALIDINTDGLAKFADVVSHAIGWKARGERKMTDALSYAKIIEEETKITTELIRLRGEEQIADYIFAKESRKVNNVLSVVEKAESQFQRDELVSNAPVDKDWLNRFFSITENISEDEMQNLWAKILAGEIKQPKSYSLRTLDLLKNISKDEAELFSNITTFYIANNFICSEESVLSLQDSLMLSDAGLLNPEGLVKTWDVPANDKLLILFNTEYYWWIYNNTQNNIHLQLNVKKLTRAGAEILLLIPNRENEEFVSGIVSNFKQKGINRIVKHRILELSDGRQIFNPIGVDL